MAKRTEYMRQWRERNREKRRRYQQRWCSENKDKVRRSRNAWSSKRNDEARLKYNVRARFRAAIKSGRIKRRPCAVCNSPDSHGHHPDYAKPFEVVWLCRIHHLDEHGKKPWD
jgi:hypothetical protein